MFNNFYKGKKVLITGHTGFKGSWLTQWLSELGADITGYSLEPPTDPSLFKILKLEYKINHIEADIRNIEKLKETFLNYKPEIVFHLAAQPLVRVSYNDPVETFDTNVMGVVNIFEAVKASKSVKIFINVTTDKCYENKEWIYGYKETDAMGGYDPYSSSKGCSELITNSYRNSFFNTKDYGIKHHTAISSARAGNVIGGGDWALDRLIPDCIKSIVEEKIIKIRNPYANRPWQHVLEPLSGYLNLALLMNEKPKELSSGWNFGPFDNDILYVDKIVKKLIEYWGSGKYIVKNNNEPHEANLLKLDISKASYYLNWQPVYNTYTAIEKTVDWYKEYYINKKINIKDFTLNQINDYTNLARNKNIKWAIN